MSAPNTIVLSRTADKGLLSTHRVLRNTYALLGLTLLFSAAVAGASIALKLPSPGVITRSAPSSASTSASRTAARW